MILFPERLSYLLITSPLAAPSTGLHTCVTTTCVATHIVAMSTIMIFIYSITLFGNILLIQLQFDLKSRILTFLMEFSKISCSTLKFNLHQLKNNITTNIFI